MRVVVGRVGKPHGIHGAVTVQVMTDVPETRFASGATLPAIDADGGERLLVVDRASWHGAKLVVTFEGVTDRTGAEGLRGLRLEIERDPAETPGAADEFFDTSLIGCQVSLADGRPIGEVRSVVHLPGQDLLEIGDEERSVLVPFVAAFVPRVDVHARRIVIDPPPGLLDADV